MSIQPIDKRLDELNQAVVESNQNADLAATVTDTPSLYPEPTPPMSERGEQLAGPLSAITSVIKGVTKAAKTAERTAPMPQGLTKEAEKAAQIQDLQRSAQAAGVETRQEVGIAGKVELAKEPAMTPEAVINEQAKVMADPEALKGKPSGMDKGVPVPEAAFNLPVMQTTDDVKAMVQAIDNLNPATVEKITFKEVADKAQEAGIGVDFIDQITSGKLAVSPENTYKALNAVVWSAKKVDSLAQKVASGTATPSEIAEMTQTIHFSNILQQEVKGYTSNIAQSLAVMRIPREGAIDIANVLESIGTETDATRFAQAYLKLTDPKAKADLIKAASQGNVWEKLFGVYVNGLLSRPTTQIKNFLSNTVFMPVRLAERGLAAGIGGVRKLVGVGSDDVYRMSEIPAILSSSPSAISDGLRMALDAWRTGVPQHWTDPIKIARQQSRMELFNYRADGSLLSTAIKGLNFMTTLPGRSLMTADEFFKAVNWKNEFTGEATRIGIKTFEDARKAGASFDDAKKLSDDAITKFADNPPEHLMQAAEVGTFTQKLEGFFGEAQKSLNPNTPLKLLARMQMPFIATPVNIIGETIQRTPLGVFSRSLWRDVLKGGTKESDMAMAKIGLGTAAMYQFSNLTTNGNITGSGPTERGTREAMSRQGWQPYSLVFDVDEANKDVFNNFPGTARFGTGDYAGKVFISYQGLEPVGALMAISADYTDYAKYEIDDQRLNAYAGGAVFGIANYTTSHPFLQGIDNIMQVVGGFMSKDRGGMVQGVNKLTEMVVTSGRKALTPLSGAITSVKEKIDPLSRDYKPDPNLDAGMYGLMEALNKMRAETPGLSESLPLKLNIWGEPVDYEYAYAPFRIKDGKSKYVDKILIQLNVNQEMPGRDASAVDPITGVSATIKLTSQEYNEMLTIANNELQLESRIESLAKEAEKRGSSSPVIYYQNAIKSEFSEAFSTARKMLISRDPALQQRLSEQAAKLIEYGKGAK